MTAVTKYQRSLLKKAAEDIVTHLKQQIRFHYDTRKLQLLFATEEELELLSKVTSTFRFDTSYQTPSVKLPVCWSHPLVPDPLDLSVSFDIDQPNYEPAWFPKNLRIRPDADDTTIAEVREGLSEFMQKKQDLMVFEEALGFVIELPTFEQMRYLFPPILRVLNSAQMGSIADKLGEARRVPHEPLDHKTRTFIRHAIQFAAVQEMLDGFNTRIAKEGVPVGHSSFSLDMSLSLLGKDADGNGVICKVNR